MRFVGLAEKQIKKNPTSKKVKSKESAKEKKGGAVCGA